MKHSKLTNKEKEVKRLIHNINERLRKVNRQFGGTFITEKMAHLVNMFTAGSRAKLNTSTGRIRETDDNIKAIAGGRQSLQSLKDIASMIDTQKIITEEVTMQRGTQAPKFIAKIGQALRKRGHKEINALVQEVNLVYVQHSRMNEVLTAMFDKIPSEEVAEATADYPNRDITVPLSEYEAKHGTLDIGDVKALYKFLDYIRYGDRPNNTTTTTYKGNNDTKLYNEDELLALLRSQKGR